MNKHLHIITHDVPWPADFGGVVDLFYKIKALHAKGIKIHLHCFVHKRPTQSILEKFCVSVNYYPRKKYFSVRYFSIPYIVQSRWSKKLLKNILLDDYPILFEGIHTTFILKYQTVLKNRKIFIRLHNVESLYYFNLFKNENNLIKKLYFLIESFLLKKYESSILDNITYLTVSEIDAFYYKNTFALKEIINIPVFLPWIKVKSELGLGSFCLYHGNLSVNENEKVAIWLAQKIFAYIPIPFVIAGKNPSNSIKNLSNLNKNICIIENPSEYELDDLIRKAQLNILPSFNSTGVKLKILHALFNGRHCIVNTQAIKGSGLNDLVEIIDEAELLIGKINYLFSLPITDLDLKRRGTLLNDLYNNDLNANNIIALL